MTATCPTCGEYLFADEEWRLRPGVPPIGDAQKGDYVHARCYTVAVADRSDGDQA